MRSERNSLDRSMNRIAPLLNWWSVAVLVAGLAAVGFVDDWIKLTDRTRNGLSPRGKLMGQLVIGLFVVGAMAWTAHASDRYSLLAIHPPFFKDWTLELGGSTLGVALFVAIGWVVVAGTSNAINITDGAAERCSFFLSNART